MKKQSNLTTEKYLRAAAVLFWLLVWQAAAAAPISLYSTRPHPVIRHTLMV
jgi:hypothetical protein